MPTFLGFRPYHLGVIALYIVLTPLAFIYFPDLLRYDVLTVNWLPTLVVLVATLLVFFFGIMPATREGNIQWRASVLCTALVQALVFAIPEEVLFRGIIQGITQLYVAAPIAILVSTAIFAASHLPNGARGLHPRHWSWGFAGLAGLAGLPLGALYALTGSLLLPTLLHTFFVLCLRLQTPKW